MSTVNTLPPAGALAAVVNLIADRTGGTITRGRALDVLDAPDHAAAVLVLDPDVELLTADDRAIVSATVADARSLAAVLTPFTDHDRICLVGVAHGNADALTTRQRRKMIRGGLLTLDDSRWILTDHGRYAHAAVDA